MESKPLKFFPLRQFEILSSGITEDNWDVKVIFDNYVMYKDFNSFQKLLNEKLKSLPPKGPFAQIVNRQVFNEIVKALSKGTSFKDVVKEIVDKSDKKCFKECQINQRTEPAQFFRVDLKPRKGKINYNKGIIEFTPGTYNLEFYYFAPEGAPFQTTFHINGLPSNQKSLGPLVILPKTSNKTAYDLTSKEAVKSYLNRVDKIRKKFELESEKLPILMRHSYEALIKHPSAIEKFVTPLHYREFDLEDWLEFLNLSEVDRSHPFFHSLDEFIVKIMRSDIFEKLIMIRIVGILRDLTILYYYYWSAIVRSSTRDELNGMLLKILMENSKELALYQELVEEGKTSCKNSFANDIIRELSKIMLEILKNQVAQRRISITLNATDVISKIEEVTKMLLT